MGSIWGMVSKPTFPSLTGWYGLLGGTLLYLTLSLITIQNGKTTSTLSRGPESNKRPCGSISVLVLTVWFDWSYRSWYCPNVSYGFDLTFSAVFGFHLMVIWEVGRSSLHAIVPIADFICVLVML